MILLRISYAYVVFSNINVGNEPDYGRRIMTKHRATEWHVEATNNSSYTYTYVNMLSGSSRNFLVVTNVTSKISKTEPVWSGNLRMPRISGITCLV